MPTYSRRSGRQAAANGEGSSSLNFSNSRRSNRRIHEDEEEEEEEEDRSTKRRKHQSSNGGDTRRRRREPSAEEEEDGGEEEGDEDEEEEAMADEDDVDGDEGAGDMGKSLWGLHTVQIKKLKVTKTSQNAVEEIGIDDVKRKANDLARLALFCEHRRIPLKREDIKKKILSDKVSSRAFPSIFNRAQKVLGFTFGYEMVELRARGTDNEQIASALQSQAAEGDGEEGEDGIARGGAKSKSYIVRSLLPAKVIAKMAEPNATLAVPVNDVNETIDGEAFDPEGVMIDWKRSRSELGSMGLTFFILSLILLNGRSIPDDLLRSYLRRMSLEPDKTLPAACQPDMNGSSTEASITVQDFLYLLIKQSYLECIKVGATAQGAMSVDASLGTRRIQARGRRSRGGEEGEMSTEDHEWRWGARAESEITEAAVAGFVADVYFASEEQDTGEAESTLKKKQETLLKHIERAAGSQLIS